MSIRKFFQHLKKKRNQRDRRLLLHWKNRSFIFRWQQVPLAPVIFEFLLFHEYGFSKRYFKHQIFRSIHREVIWKSDALNKLTNAQVPNKKFYQTKTRLQGFSFANSNLRKIREIFELDFVQSQLFNFFRVFSDERVHHVLPATVSCMMNSYILTDIVNM